MIIRLNKHTQQIYHILNYINITVYVFDLMYNIIKENNEMVDAPGILNLFESTKCVSTCEFSFKKFAGNRNRFQYIGCEEIK